MVSQVARRWLGIGFGISRLVSFFVINRASDRRSVIIPTQHAVFSLEDGQSHLGLYSGVDL